VLGVLPPLRPIRRIAIERRVRRVRIGRCPRKPRPADRGYRDTGGLCLRLGATTAASGPRHSLSLHRVSAWPAIQPAVSGQL
jgi:hypothetical protein